MMSVSTVDNLYAAFPERGNAAVTISRSRREKQRTSNRQHKEQDEKRKATHAKKQEEKSANPVARIHTQCKWRTAKTIYEPQVPGLNRYRVPPPLRPFQSLTALQARPRPSFAFI